MIISNLFGQQDHKISIQSCLKPFYHGVASGDPMSDKVIIWTRVTPDTISNNPVLVSWRMATDTGMVNIVKNGSVLTNNQKDYTVKVDVTGLTANTWYYYEFTVNGKNSPRGRTRTTPNSENVDSLRFAVVSCINFESGFFNSYKILLERADFDAVICLGDYIYEYESGGYGPNPTANRQWLPSNEILSLSDYRQRYSTYHLDDDLRKLHQQFPFIVIWDDHEVADNSWLNGAENHQANEGPFSVRKANAKQAYFEWLPIRQTSSIDPFRIFRNLRYGNLVDFIMLDTRLHGREQQAGTTGAIVNASTRQLLGTDQFTWLSNRLDSSSCQWKVLTQQVMIAPLEAFGIAVNEDQWDGYPAERNRVLTHIMTHNITNVVALTGDIHSSWANDIPTSTYNSSTGAGSAGVEFVAPGVTSPAMSIPVSVSAIMAVNSHIKYANITDHGFLILDINKNKVQCEWKYVNTLDQSSSIHTNAASFYVNNLERFLRSSSSVISPRASIFGTMAPICPRVLIPNPIGMQEFSKVTLLNVLPNPASNQLHLNFLNLDIDQAMVIITNTMGQQVLEIPFSSSDLFNGHQLILPINSLTEGLYNGIVKYKNETSYFKFIKQIN